MPANVVLIVHNIRSCHNVGSLLRTSDGLGVKKVYLTGYTPYPPTNRDDRLPHIASKIGHQIKKTSLGAEKSVSWEHHNDLKPLLTRLRRDGYKIAALEQEPGSVSLPKFSSKDDLALIVGNEVDGIDKDILANTDFRLEIPMMGSKESFNVSVAAAIALYHLKCNC